MKRAGRRRRAPGRSFASCPHLFDTGTWLFSSVTSECLRKAEMKLARLQTYDLLNGRGRVEGELRRVQQVAVVYGERPSDRRLDTEAEADRVRPAYQEVRVFARLEVAAKDVADAAKHVAAIVERHDLKS